ncbi:rotatin-like isoform X2 [Cherax quadricarinatus]|uniref:rotatin-like isoform X2 n=1 Tax=Cherax quadricarinatus TaxID=27406 RepID=UPI00387EAFB7
MTHVPEYIDKLVHPILEIRGRALSSLLQKVELNLVTCGRLSQYPKFLPNLLQLLDLGPHTLRFQVLNLLSFMFKDDSARRQFASLGGTYYLRSLKATAPLDLLPDINHLLQKLQNCPHQASEDITSRSPELQPQAEEKKGQHWAALDDTEENSLSFTSNQGANFSEMGYTVDGSHMESLFDLTLQEPSATDQNSPVTFTVFPWQAVYGCIEEEGELAWRVQGPACSCLLTLTQLLSRRIAHFKDPHLMPEKEEIASSSSSGLNTPNMDINRSCCSFFGGYMQNIGAHGHVRHTKGKDEGHLGDGPNRSGSFNNVIKDLSGTTTHEEDDGDEFILLGMHQLTVTGHCSHIMRRLCSLMVSPRPSIQDVSLRLLTSCLALLQQCVQPQFLWEQEDYDEVSEEITGEIRRIILCISYLIVAGFEAKRSASTNTEAERQVMNINCLALILYRILTDFIPLEASSQVIDNDVCEGMIRILCDGGFYFEHMSQHNVLLKHLSIANPTVGTQIKSVLFAAQSLKATSDFLQTSSSQQVQFLDLAEKAIPVSSIHQSNVLVEKFVRGVAKQISLGNMEEEHVEKAQMLLLQILRFPDATIRLSGYKSVQRLVEDSVGASQAVDTLMTRSPRILLLLSPTVIRHLVYFGLADDNEEVMKAAKGIILGLLNGHPLMNASVLTAAVHCWYSCLTDLQCLSDSVSSLGRVVTNLPSVVYKGDGTLQNIEHLKYWLQCLYLRDRDTRIQALSRVVQKLVTTTSDFLPDPRDFHLAVHHDLLIIKHPIPLFFMSNLISEEGRLMKVLELILGQGIDPGVCKAAWSQLAFLLEDPQLHRPFLQLCSLQFLVMNFVNMMKRDGSQNLTVEYLPGAVETLRLLVTHSAHIRSKLLKDEEFLLCVVRAALLYYADDRTRSQASCLLALLVFNDVIIYMGTENEQKQVNGVRKDFICVPELLPSKLHLPFLCGTYIWHERNGLCEEMRTVHQIIQERDWQVLDFLKAVWAASCVGGLEKIDQTSKFSVSLQLSKYEAALLKSSVLSVAMTKLLKNVENATSHKDVKKNINTLSFYIQQVQFASCKCEDFFISSQWIQSLQRFLTSQPNSSVDEQLLTHILNFLSVSLSIYIPVVKAGTSLCPPLLPLLLNELKNKKSALYHTLQSAGGVLWVASDPNPRALMSMRLFRSITKLISDVLKFVHCCGACQASFDSAALDQLAATIINCLLPLLTANNDLHNYNLVIIGCLLECLVQVTALGWPGEELSRQLASHLIRLISTFHVGRGRAHNSYMGRMVTLCSSLALIHLLSNPEGDLTQDAAIWSNEEGVLDWSWLVSLWVYCDPSVTSIGLAVASALITQTCGLSLLHNSLTQASGGVWGAALSYLLSDGRSCLVRTCAAQLLIKLTRTGPTHSNPWTSPVVTDTLTGESVEGLPALMVLLQHCSFYSMVCSSMAKLHVSQEPVVINARPSRQGELDLSVSRFSSFLVSENDVHNTTENMSNRNSNNRSVSHLMSIQLYETLLRLLINILLLQPSQVISQLSSHNVISLIIKQLRFIVWEIKTSKFYLQAVEMALVLIGAVLKYDPAQAPSLARDTSLVHLSLVVLSSGIEKESVTIVSLEVLNALVCGRGWGAARIIEWISVSPALILRPMVAGFHVSASAERQAATVAFLTNLLHEVFHSEISTQQDLPVVISRVLDDPVQLLNDQNVCPGWELSRHIIQLICGLPDCEDPNKQPAAQQKTDILCMDQEHLFLLLDSLKLLLLASQSAKEAAHHFRHFLLPTLTKSFSDLQNKLQNVNIHITAQLMKIKEIKDTICIIIQILEIATNWIEVRGNWLLMVGETFVPLLHPLWTPAIQTLPLLEAILKFLLAASSHHQICLLLTRTSGLPGVLLSTSRTKRPLLACITTAVCQQLEKLLTYSRSFTLCFKDFSRDSFLAAISVLINCARVQECTYVMNRLDLVPSLIKWLQCKAAVEEGMVITPSIVKLLVLVTTHHESQIAVCKTYGWLSTIQDLILHDSLQTDALRIMANMSLNHYSAHALLASDNFIKTIVGIIGNSETELWVEIALGILWALVSNNQRGQAIIKQYPVIPLLNNLIELQMDKKSFLSKKILDILN